MPILELNAQHASISPALFREALNKLPNNLERIEMHPWLLMAYEEMGFANVTVSFKEGKMPGFDGVPNGGAAFTIGGIPAHGNSKVPKDTVKFFVNGESVGEIKNIAEPVFE